MILFYGDQHLRDFGSFPPFNVDGPMGLTKELWNIIKAFKWVAGLIEKHKPEIVVNLGDAFHNNEYISARTLHGAAISFGYIAKACRDVRAKHIVLPGNHDIYSQGSNFDMITSASILCGHGEVKGSPHIETLRSGFKLGTVPYTHDLNDAYLALTDMSEKVDLIATHLDFEGAIYESGVESKSKLIPDFKVPIVSGHIHTQSTVGCVTYSGSLIQHRFGQRDLKGVGGCILFDPEKEEMTHIPNSASQHYLRIDLDQAIEKHGRIPFAADQVLLQAYTEKPLDQVKHYLEGYDHVLLSKKLVKEAEEIEPVRFNIEKPEKLLRKKIAEERPEALKEFDKIMKDWSES